jgi:hypothetical protein
MSYSIKDVEIMDFAKKGLNTIHLGITFIVVACVFWGGGIAVILLSKEAGEEGFILIISSFVLFLLGIACAPLSYISFRNYFKERTLILNALKNGTYTEGQIIAFKEKILPLGVQRSKASTFLNKYFTFNYSYKSVDGTIRIRESATTISEIEKNRLIGHSVLKILADADNDIFLILK